MQQLVPQQREHGPHALRADRGPITAETQPLSHDSPLPRRRNRDVHRAHRRPVLRLRPRDAGGRHAPVRAQQPPGADGELAGHLRVHRAPLVEERAADPQHLALDLGGVGGDRAPERPGGPRDVGERRRHQPAGQ
ncbi:hypothetical protein GCM10022227_36540 [Streptomyces sedi]